MILLRPILHRDKFHNAFVAARKAPYSRLRDESLRLKEFVNLSRTRACGVVWREVYNDYRPHSSLGGLVPFEFVR